MAAEVLLCSFTSTAHCLKKVLLPSSVVVSRSVHPPYVQNEKKTQSAMQTCSNHKKVFPLCVFVLRWEGDWRGGREWDVLGWRSSRVGWAVTVPKFASMIRSLTHHASPSTACTALEFEMKPFNQRQLLGSCHQITLSLPSNLSHALIFTFTTSMRRHGESKTCNTHRTFAEAEPQNVRAAGT